MHPALAISRQQRFADDRRATLRTRRGAPSGKAQLLLTVRPIQMRCEDRLHLRAHGHRSALAHPTTVAVTGSERIRASHS